MDQYLTFSAMRNQLLSALLLTTSAGSALADATLRDPTRPPQSISQPATDNVTDSGSPVQFISISGKQRTALVRGVLVKVGDQISEGRIIHIASTGITVRSDEGVSVLKLFPDVDKYSVDKHMHAPITQQSLRSSNQR